MLKRKDELSRDSQEALAKIANRLKDKEREVNAKRLKRAKSKTEVLQELHVTILVKHKGVIKKIPPCLPSAVGRKTFVSISVRSTSNSVEWAQLAQDKFDDVDLVPYDMNDIGLFTKMKDPLNFTYDKLREKYKHLRAKSDRWAVYMYAVGKSKEAVRDAYIKKKIGLQDTKNNGDDAFVHDSGENTQKEGDSDDDVFVVQSRPGSPGSSSEHDRTSHDVTENLQDIPDIPVDINVTRADSPPTADVNIVPATPPPTGSKSRGSNNRSENDNYSLPSPRIAAASKGPDNSVTESPSQENKTQISKKKKRKEAALKRVTVLPLPCVNESKRQVSLFHNGEVFERPFRMLDSVKDVFDWVCAEMSDNDLPARFSLHCYDGEKCTDTTCSHEYTMSSDTEFTNVSELPEMIVVKEVADDGDDTMTNFDEVFFVELF
ncbi:uncharacterized protein [Ptychodera flava]|uniref:uncharacterized protein n=1 Tax=Ptychodera flava TaxID=63121 RepID=UPI00396A043E